VPPYVIAHDATLAAIAEQLPDTEMRLRGIAGMGPVKVERYGSDILRVVRET
jgi:superfamily II DNA helicase RecQ